VIGCLKETLVGFLTLREVFGDDLPGDRRFVGELTGWLASLLTRGARATLTQAAGRCSS
jgi:hypothetical protein